VARKVNTKALSTKGERVARRIKSVDEANKFVKILVYGKNKKGKTRFAATGPECLIIDIDEEGTRSATGSGADVLEVSQFDDVGHIFWWLKAGNHEYETVVLDTVTALQAAAMRKVLGESEDRDPTREVATPDRRTYGRANQLVKQLLLDFRNLKMHVIFLAQERDVKDDEDEESSTFHTVDLPPGTRATALGSVGIIGRIYLREVKVKGQKRPEWEARMLVGPHEDYDSGNRVDGLPIIVRDPTMPKFIKAWAANPPDDEE